MSDDNIHVAIRMRPLVKREKESKASIHWKADGSSVVQNNQPLNKFQFDRVFREVDSNEIVYAEFCSPLVKSVIDGFNSTIFAYGQTSSGKTFTMMGKDNGKELGIAHYTVSDIFNHIQERSEREFLLRVSYMEIYNESVFDLLSDESKHMKLTDRDGLIKVSGLSEHIVQKPEQVLQLMRKGEKNRKIGHTNMNERSSRSHSIFQVIIESGVRGDDNSAVNVSQFNLVDLAGSERAAQTGAKDARLTESKYINLSLLMLSQVIRQLSEKPDQFINYRGSKLTRILQNSLGGNARTAIICTITPAALEETVSTLKFATRAKCIRNKPQVNEVLTEQALLKRYANEIKKLTQELEATKEEKDQENKSLKEQILSLRNKFVSQITNEKRSARRETWGGCLDATKFKVPFLPPLRKKSFSNTDSYDTSTSKVSNLVDSSVFCEKEPSRRTGSNPYGDLSTVDEENEVDAFDGTFPSRNSRLQSNRFSNVCSYTETGVQTDVSSMESRVFLDLEEKVIHLEAKVKNLENELAERAEFTSLEKQYYAEYKKSENRSTVIQSVVASMVDAGMNTSIDHASSTVCENPEIIDLKSRIVALEEDVALHLKTISDLQEDLDLKSDEMQLQTEIAECLKEELAAKDEEIASYKMVQDDCVDVKLNCSSQTSYLEENEAITEKLSLLDSEISKNTKVISDLEYERDSKDKQIALCKDKIKIQEQIILSLQTEISLKTEESTSSKTPLYVDSSSQTCYLGGLSPDCHSYDQKDNEHEISVFEEASSSDNQGAENCSNESPIENIVDGENNNCGVFSGSPDIDEDSLKLALKEFTDLRQFTVEFMERHMDEVYFRCVFESDTSEPPASVQDSIKSESGTLRKLLQRIEFYLRDKCESYEYFQDVLRDTSNEMIELKSQLADAESQLKQSENEMQGLYQTFKDLESEAATSLKEFEAPESLAWKDSISLEGAGKALKYISLLKMVNKMLKYFVEDRKSLSSKTTSTVAEVEDPPQKVSKAIQTAEDERLLQMSAELESLKAEKYSLVLDASHFNSRIEKLKKFREEAEDRYQAEIQNLKLMVESEKNVWTKHAEKCVQSVEEKYDQIMNEQEVRFCKELDKAKSQLKELVAKYEKDIINLKKDHLEKLTETQDKLSSTLNERIELENTISCLKKEMSSRAEIITKLKYKCGSYALELRKQKASVEKSVAGVQTSSALAEVKMAFPVKEQVATRNVETKDFAAQTNSPEIVEKVNDQPAAVLSQKNNALRKEIEDLKRDLSSKMMLLRNCHCKLNPPVLGKSKPAGGKSSESSQTGTKKEEQRGKLTFSSAAEVLQSDVVKKAIELEVEKERYKLSDSGTASTLVNCMLKKDLHSREKALAAAQEEIVRLKAYAKGRNALPVNENRPFPCSDDVTEYIRGSHPYPPGQVPKLPSKNMLREKNQVPRLNHPAAIKPKDTKGILTGKPVYSNTNPSQAASEKVNSKQDVEEFKQQLKEDPNCKVQ